MSLYDDFRAMRDAIAKPPPRPRVIRITDDAPSPHGVHRVPFADAAGGFYEVHIHPDQWAEILTATDDGAFRVKIEAHSFGLDALLGVPVVIGGP